MKHLDKMIDILKTYDIEELLYIEKNMIDIRRKHDDSLHSSLASFDIEAVEKSRAIYSADLNLFSFCKKNIFTELKSENIPYLEWLITQVDFKANPEKIKEVCYASLSDFSLFNYLKTNNIFNTELKNVLNDKDSLQYLSSIEILQILQKKKDGFDDNTLFFDLFQAHKWNCIEYLYNEKNITLAYEDIKYLFCDNRFSIPDNIRDLMYQKNPNLKNVSLEFIIEYHISNKNSFNISYLYIDFLIKDFKKFEKFINEYTITPSLIEKIMKATNSLSKDNNYSLEINTFFETALSKDINNSTILINNKKLLSTKYQSNLDSVIQYVELQNSLTNVSNKPSKSKKI